MAEERPMDLCYCPACGKVIFMPVDPPWPTNARGYFVHECLKCAAKPKLKAPPTKGLFQAEI